MKNRSWVVLILCVVVFIALRLLPSIRETKDEGEAAKPVVPEPILVKSPLFAHPWMQQQPKVRELNAEIVRDLASLEELCGEVREQRPDFSNEQIQRALIQTLVAMQKGLPCALPDDLYSVLCIRETPQEWIDPPLPFHVYKRLYLGEMETGLPFYLDVRVFELDGMPAGDVIAWHLETLDGERTLHHRSEGRVIYTVQGERSYETAHGFAQGMRGMFIDCIEENERLYVVYAEAPIKTFLSQNSLFKQLIERINNG